MEKFQRGDILRISLKEQGGSVQSGIRPCIVVSNDIGNRCSTILLVVPLTSKMTKKPLPTHVMIAPSNRTGLGRSSIALCEQVTVVPQERVISKYGSLTLQQQEDVNQSLQVAMALPASTKGGEK